MWAHSAAHGVRQSLVDHLDGTSRLAARFGASFGLPEHARWLGLAHDCGKAGKQWQAGLLRVEPTGGRVGIDHKSLGAQIARSGGFAAGKLIIAGHHGGLTLPVAVDYKLDEWLDAEGEACAAEARAALHGLRPEIFAKVPQSPDGFDEGDASLSEFLVRFLYSTLVDADALDTQAHRQGWRLPRLAEPADFVALWMLFKQRRREFLVRRGPGPMDALREKVFAACCDAAAGKQGIYRLTAPTGAAKTIGVAAFGLLHALVHRLDRVIVAVPYTTITSQNAQVYHNLLDTDGAEAVVLEHHSQVDLDVQGDQHELWRRQAAENWDAPFVATTTVQLFDSLFGRKPSQMRKVHRLANSVIILDEVQALPHGLLPVICDGLRLLAQRFGATIVLSSATQPELWEFEPLQQLQPREIVPDVAALFDGVKRVRYEWRTEPGLELAEVVQEAVTHRQVLMVLNTVRDAARAYSLAVDAIGNGGTVRHLSTMMCPAHRKAVLAEVNDALGGGLPVFLASTSLIEAGVDIDFPVAFRAEGPPEAMAQVAGRCNREGRLGEGGGLVVLFRTVDTGAPPSYKTQIKTGRRFFGPRDQEHGDPEDLDKLRRYFPRLYNGLALDERSSRSSVIQRNRAKLDFEAVACGPIVDDGLKTRDPRYAFRIVDADTVQVVVPYAGPQGDDDALRRRVKALVAQVRDGTAPPGALRELQPYTTTIRRETRQRPDVTGACYPVIGDLVEWEGEYDAQKGLVLEPSGEDFIA